VIRRENCSAPAAAASIAWRLADAREKYAEYLEHEIGDQ
jgi:hypothetical protein